MTGGVIKTVAAGEGVDEQVGATGIPHQEVTGHSHALQGDAAATPDLDEEHRQ